MERASLSALLEELRLRRLRGASGVIVKEEDEKVRVRVQQQGTPDFYFAIKRTEPLRKLMIAYCVRRGISDYRSLRFHLNGDKITGSQTPNELELENDDVIDAWADQMGGAPAAFYFK